MVGMVCPQSLHLGIGRNTLVWRQLRYSVNVDRWLWFCCSAVLFVCRNLERLWKMHPYVRTECVFFYGRKWGPSGLPLNRMGVMRKCMVRQYILQNIFKEQGAQI